MTDLLESLLEFSRTRESVRPSYGDVARRSIAPCRGQGIPIPTHTDFTFPRKARPRGWFDFKKLERALLNLLLTRAKPSRRKREDRDGLPVRGKVWKFASKITGPGSADAVRDHLFEPFVSHGKENGTGMD